MTGSNFIPFSKHGKSFKKGNEELPFWNEITYKILTEFIRSFSRKKQVI